MIRILDKFLQHVLVGGGVLYQSVDTGGVEWAYYEHFKSCWSVSYEGSSK